MYELFIDRARKVMQLANQEAQRRNEEKVCTHHLLLALLKEGSGLAAVVLKNFNLTLEVIRAEMEKHVPSGPDIITMGKLPTSPKLMTVVKESINEAAKLNSYVGTEHLLLGLMAGENIAVSIILGLRIDPAMVRAEVMRLIEHRSSQEATKGYGSSATKIAMKAVEQTAKSRYEMIELLGAAYARHDPTQCQLVEQRHADGRITWHFEPKTPPSVGALGIFQPFTGNGEVCCSYDETDVLAMGLSVNDVVGDHVVLRNDRPTPNTKGQLVLLCRPMRVFHYPENPENLRAKMWSQQIAIGGTIDMGSNLAPLVPDQAIKAARDLEKPVPDPAIMQLHKHAEEHFSGDVALSQSMPSNAQPVVSECRCKSLLNGHEAGCPMA